jgi:amino acid permease
MIRRRIKPTLASLCSLVQYFFLGFFVLVTIGIIIKDNIYLKLIQTIIPLEIRMKMFKSHLLLYSLSFMGMWCLNHGTFNF